MPPYPEPEDAVFVRDGALRDWSAELLHGLGTPADIAADVAEVLVAADRRGIASHGTARLPQYVSLVDAGVLDPAGRPAQDGGAGATARFDAHNGWGPHAGRVAVDWAIGQARISSIALSLVHHSNHYGIAGWYALRAADAGLLGLSFTSASPLIAPTRTAEPLLGTNPIAFAAPADGRAPFCLDMATSVVPRGRIEVAARRRELLPAGWAIGRGGEPATTPEAALEGALLPLGGEEVTAGYKGYGLALAVEILTSVLADAAMGPEIVPLFSTHHGPADLAHTFLVIDPAALDGRRSFEGRLSHLLGSVANARPIDPARPVLVPGDPESDAERRATARGIAIDRPTAESLRVLGRRLGAAFPA